MYEQDVKLEVDKQGETFKPGLPYAVVVALKQMDDGPAKSSLPRRVQLTTFYFYPSSSQEDKDVKVLELDAHGTAMMHLLVGKLLRIPQNPNHSAAPNQLLQCPCRGRLRPRWP